jgi:hypothetical protein
MTTAATAGSIAFEEPCYYTLVKSGAEKGYTDSISQIFAVRSRLASEV